MGTGIENDGYIPALNYRWLTGLYDPVVRLTTRETTVKRQLVKQARVMRGERALDLGCGTGTLALLIKAAQPGAAVVGIDADPDALKIAQAKATSAAVQIVLDRGLVTALPYPDASFDHVFSSLVFHHLAHENKERALREVRRVLRPQGRFHLADWGFPANRLMRVLFFLVQLLDGFATTDDNVSGRLPRLLRDAGLSQVAQTASYATLFGTIRSYSGSKP